MKTDSFYIRALLAVVAITALFAFVFARHQKSQGDLGQASSFNAAPAGNKALYVTLQELGWPVARWQSSLRDLSGVNQVLILTRNRLGRWYSLQKNEADHLLAWAGAGNELILLGDFASAADTRYLLERLHFRLPRALATSEMLFEQSREALATERTGMTLFPMENETRHPVLELQKSSPLPSAPSTAVVLWQDQYLPYVMRLPVGRGAVTWCASSSLLDNEFLRKANNLPYVITLLAVNGQVPEKIWFEESHHGYLVSYALIDLLQQPGLRLAAIQAAMGLLLFLTSQLTRFGPVIPLDREQGRNTLEFVNSMAQLYRRANLRNEIVHFLFNETHQRILQKFNLPLRTSHEITAQRLRDAFPHLPGWKKIAQRFDSPDLAQQSLPPSGWLKMSRDLIRIKREMV